MKDDLGNRIKNQYEYRTRYLLPRRTYTIIRLDQKCGHTYTKGLNKPFDKGYMEDMDSAVIEMLPEIQGAVFAYLQSDECSVLLTDFATPQTDAWFDGNLQKITSVAASIMTAEFNKFRMVRNCTNFGASENCLTKSEIEKFSLAFFDCRCFTIPDRVEVMNYFIWRGNDCSRNSVSMVAQHYFSHKELEGKNTPQMHEMLHQKGVNWATDYSDGEKNGRLIVKETYISKRAQFDSSLLLGNPMNERTRWISKGAWKFTENKEKLLEMIPKYE